MSAMPSSPAKFAGGSDAWLGDGNATRDTMMLVFEIPHLSSGGPGIMTVATTTRPLTSAEPPNTVRHLRRL